MSTLVSFEDLGREIVEGSWGRERLTPKSATDEEVIIGILAYIAKTLNSLVDQTPERKAELAEQSADRERFMEGIKLWTDVINREIDEKRSQWVDSPSSLIENAIEKWLVRRAWAAIPDRKIKDLTPELAETAAEAVRTSKPPKELAGPRTKTQKEWEAIYDAKFGGNGKV